MYLYKKGIVKRTLQRFTDAQKRKTHYKASQRKDYHTRMLPVCYRYVTSKVRRNQIMKSVIAQLSKNKTKTPVEVFDAQPYVHFQRQLYFAKVCT